MLKERCSLLTGRGLVALAVCDDGAGLCVAEELGVVGVAAVPGIEPVHASVASSRGVALVGADDATAGHHGVRVLARPGRLSAGSGAKACDAGQREAVDVPGDEQPAPGTAGIGRVTLVGPNSAVCP